MGPRRHTARLQRACREPIALTLWPMEPDDHLRAWCQGILGQSLGFSPCGWPGGVAKVWKVMDAAGQGVAFLKVPKSKRSFDAERQALRTIATQVPAAQRFIAGITSGSSGALLTEVAPGIILDHLSEPNPETYRQAGAWLQRLHNLEYHDSDPLPLHEALEQRCHSWSQRAQPHLPASAIQGIEQQFHGLFAPEIAPRVLCHRDYSPRNWLWDLHSQSLTVIDFEHTRADCWLADIVRLRARWWINAPDLEAAFWQGYGRKPNADEERTLRGLLLLHALGCVAWGSEHADHAFAKEGLGILEDFNLI